jgi:hypothetical protein
MKRLIEERDELVALDRKLAELLNTAERFEPDPVRKRRVFHAVVTENARSARYWWRPLVVVALVLGGTATAAAFAVQRWAAREAEAPAQVVSTVSKESQVSAAVPRGAPDPPAAVESAEPPAAEAAQEPVAASSKLRPARGAVKSTPGAERVPGEDPTEMVQAIRALRKDQDPARAQRHLNQYLEDNPDGVLSEDALALSIEAAAQRGDPRAKDFARRYLSKYPNGRHREVALRALAK